MPRLATDRGLELNPILCLKKPSCRRALLASAKSYPSVADGNGGNIEKGSITYDICQKNLEEIILVEEDDIKLAARVFLENERALIEPTTAVGLAGYMKVHKQFKGKNIVIVTCGRNVTMPTLNKILEDTKHMKMKK